MEWWQMILAGIPSLLSGILLFEWKQQRAQSKKEETEKEQKHAALVTGVVAMLRDRIIDAMDYYLALGWVPHHKAEVVNKMYVAYHNLGGNDIVSLTYQHFMTLPHTAPSKEEGNANV